MKSQILSLGERERIATAAIDLIEHEGVMLTESEAVELVHGAGAKVDGDRVRMPSSLVLAAIESAPEGISIYDRLGNRTMRLEGNNHYFGAVTDAPEVIDPFTGVRRPCTFEDVRRNVLLVDALDNMYFANATGIISDRPPEMGAVLSASLSFIYSTKPLLAEPVTLEMVEACREMAALAVGGEKILRKRPILIVYSEPLSPLAHPDLSITKLLYCAEHEIPLVYTPYAAAGATAPMSIVGNVVQLCAESLSGLVLHQLKRRGAPFIFGAMPSIMDMATTVFSYGAPEFQLGNTMMAEMAHHFRLPNFGTGGSSDSQVFDGQAIIEATSSCMMAIQCGGHLVHNVGMHGNGTLVIPEMITATSEIIEMQEAMLGGVVVNDETMAMDQIREVGPMGEYVTNAHTMAHFKDVWYPKLLFRGGDKAWKASEQLTFEQRVTERTRNLIAKHEPKLIPEEIKRQIEEVVVRAEALSAEQPGGVTHDLTP